MICSTYGGGNKSDIGYAISSYNTYLFLIGSTRSYFVNAALENYPLVTLPIPAYNQTSNVTAAGHPFWSDGFLSRFDVGLHIGIDELSENKGRILAYPNPVTGEVTFLLDNDNHSDLSYSINNLFGQTLQSGRIKESSKNSFSIDMSKYPPGVYFASVISLNKVATIKIIKQ